jgi:hypothetical protein
VRTRADLFAVSAGPARVVLMVSALGCVASPARADQTCPVAPSPAAAAAVSPAPLASRALTWGSLVDVTSVPSFLLFAGGALSGLALHELGHVTANLGYGNAPTVQGIVIDHFIPWFVIDARLTYAHGVYYQHDGAVFAGGGRGYYVINTAGFMVQNLGSEILLSAQPALRDVHAPFAKGLLWMNILLSLGYSTASLLGVEDPHGDIYGGSRHSGYPSQLIAGVVFSNGTLDLLRYLFPENAWLPWLSRASKVMLFGMDLPFEY